MAPAVHITSSDLAVSSSQLSPFAALSLASALPGLQWQRAPWRVAAAAGKAGLPLVLAWQFVAWDSA